MLPEICEYTKNLGAKGIKFINLVKEGNATKYDNDVFLNKKDLLEFFNILYETRKLYNKEEFYVARACQFGNDLEHKSNFYCSVGVGELVLLTPDGSVYPCNCSLHDDAKIGHWDEEKIYIDNEIFYDPNECTGLKRQL